MALTNDKQTHEDIIGIKPCSLVGKTPFALKLNGCHQKAY
jgi:hypothetical protein